MPLSNVGQEPRSAVAPDSRESFRFSLADLLRWTTLAGCVFALAYWLGPWGWLLAPVVVLGYGVLRKDWQLFLDGVLVLGSAIVLLVLLLPLNSGPRSGPPSRRITCQSNLRQIAIAIDQSHQKHGCYPPAHFTDERGRPTHS
jgi:hypothetical protein